VSEDGLRVRRAKQLAVGEEELINKAVEERSLYVAPFPMSSTLDGARPEAAACAACLTPGLRPPRRADRIPEHLRCCAQRAATQARDQRRLQGLRLR